MPRFVSKNGVWIPKSKSAKRELAAQGIDHLGQEATDDANLAVETPVHNEDLIRRSKDKDARSKLHKVKVRQGVRSKTVRQKVG